MAPVYDFYKQYEYDSPIRGLYWVRVEREDYYDIVVISSKEWWDEIRWRWCLLTMNIPFTMSSSILIPSSFTMSKPLIPPSYSPHQEGNPASKLVRFGVFLWIFSSLHPHSDSSQYKGFPGLESVKTYFQFAKTAAGLRTTQPQLILVLLKSRTLNAWNIAR